MVKGTFTVFMMMLLPCVANAQQVYMETGFDEGIPSEFTLHDMDGRTPSTDMQNLGFEVGTPWIIIEEGKDNNKVACSTSWYKNAGQSDDWMVTGAITIESPEAILSWRSRASDKDYRDGFSVYVSEKGTAVDDFDKEKPLFTSARENVDWTEHSLSLADYAGKTIYIAFVNDSKDKTCLYVDDIFVGIESSVGLTLDLGRVINDFGEVKVSGKVFATGDKDVQGYTIGYAINGQTYEQDFDGTLMAGKSYDFTLDQPFTIRRNETLEYSVYVKSGADIATKNGYVSAYPWKLVSEEVTGTWCGYCVRGIVAMKEMNGKYPDGFIGIALHSGSVNWPDAMAVGVEDYHDALFSACGISGYPRSVYNRNIMYSIDPANMETYYTMIRNNDTNNSGIEIRAKYVPSTGEIDAETEVYFSEDIANANYKLAYVLVEDNVHVTRADLGLSEEEFSGYEQNNYYAGGSMGEMGGFEDLPEVVMPEQMWYNDVARGIWPDYEGMADVIPSTIEEGKQYVHDYTISVPANVLKPENLSLIVLLIDKNGLIANADKVELGEKTTGISTVGKAISDDNAWYRLDGVRVEKPVKGVYIHNGKKVVF